MEPISRAYVEEMLAYDAGDVVFYGGKDKPEYTHRRLVEFGCINEEVRSLFVAAPEMFRTLTRISLFLSDLERAFDTGDIFLVDEQEVVRKIDLCLNACIASQTQALYGIEAMHKKIVNERCVSYKN